MLLSPLTSWPLMQIVMNPFCIVVLFIGSQHLRLHFWNASMVVWSKSKLVVRSVHVGLHDGRSLVMEMCHFMCEATDIMLKGAANIPTHIHHHHHHSLLCISPFPIMQYYTWQTYTASPWRPLDHIPPREWLKPLKWIQWILSHDV